MNIGVLASHEGTTLQAIIDACEAGRIAGRVVLVISNNSDAGALRRARQHEIPNLHISARTHAGVDKSDQAIATALKGANVELVMLAGYMKKLGQPVLAAYPDRILNTHPALLPKYGGTGFYGRRVHDAVLAAGETETGVSIHIVSEAYDSGPIVAQCRIPVSPDDTTDTLMTRVQAREREFVIQTIAEIASGERALPVS